MYADDLTIYVVVNNNEDNKWQLTINYDKCHIIHIGNNDLYFDYNLDMCNIIVSKCEKVLKIYI